MAEHDQSAAYSPSKAPDGVALRAAPRHRHRLFDTKVGTPHTLANGVSTTPVASSLAPFAKTLAHFHRTALGFGTTGGGEYSIPVANGHVVTLLIHEVSGATSPRTRALLAKLSSKLDPETLVAHGALLTWSNQSSPLAYYSQRISLALHDHVACEVCVCAAPQLGCALS